MQRALETTVQVHVDFRQQIDIVEDVAIEPAQSSHLQEADIQQSGPIKYLWPELGKTNG